MKYSLLVISLVLIGGTGCVFADNSIKSCIDYLHQGVPCYQYEPKVTSSTALNWNMDIIAPNNTCNIFGTLIPSSGACTYQSITLNQTSFDQLKSNPSVLAVVHIQQSAMPAQNYCPVAIWTYESQDASFKAKYNSSLVIPANCGPAPVPEFGPVASIVLALAVLSIITVASKTGLRIK